MNLIDDLREEAIDQENAVPGDSAYVADLLRRVIIEIERLRKYLVREQAKNFQYEAEKASPGMMRAEIERLGHRIYEMTMESLAAEAAKGNKDG